MTLSRRVPLNPCDYCIYGQDRAGYAPFGAANVPYMMVDALGHVEPDAVMSALARAMAAHPVTMAALRVSPLRLRPYWRVPEPTHRATLNSVRAAFSHDDLRSVSDWRRPFDELCQRRYTASWDSRRGPQVRLEHYALPDDHTRLVLRWPHFLMDATGAQGFLSKLDDAHSQDSARSSGSPDSLRPDDPTVDILQGYSLARRLKLAQDGLRGQSLPPSLAVRHLLDGEPAAFRDFRFLHRHWDADLLATLRANAKQSTPSGPALFSRYLAAGVFRALHRIYTERNIDTDAYCITLPMRVGSSKPGITAMQRPLTGNYLVAPMIWCRREEAEDRNAIAECILRQLQLFLASNGDLSQWAMLHFAAMVHPWFYRWLYKLPLGVDRFASGFSYYGEIESPLSHIDGAKVVNIRGGGPTTTPPGWNPVFSKFGDRLNLSMTYSRPAISDESAVRYVTLIESELLDPT